MAKDIEVKGGIKGIKELKLDLITFEVLRNAFVAACYEASTAIEQMAYHPVVGMGRDRSNGILTIDGNGWQRQAEEPTVQAEIERALGRMTRSTVTVIGAGRTDAGVHALG